MRAFTVILIVLSAYTTSIGQSIKWNETTVNFGSVRDWNSPPATFTFTNVGNKRLMFLPQKHGREILVEYPERVFEPGESGQLIIQYFTAEEGNFDRTVEIFSNASTKAVKLNLKGNIKSIYANALTSCPSFQTTDLPRNTVPNVIQVVDALTGEPLMNAQVEVYDRGIRKALNGTNRQGIAVNWIEPGKYSVIANRSGYDKAVTEVMFTKRERNQVVYLNRTVKEDVRTIEEEVLNDVPTDLGIATNETLSREAEMEQDTREIAEPIVLGIATNGQWPEERKEKDPSEDERDDLGITLNDQWTEETQPALKENEVGVRTETRDAPIAVASEEYRAETVTSSESDDPREEQSREEPETEFAVNSFKPNNVLLLLDVSGSMRDDDNIGKLKSSIRRLVLMLRDIDVLTIIAYNSTSWEVLPPTPVTNNLAIVALVDSLVPSGYTNGVKGMETAYESLLQQLINGGNNQLIIATDGKFNSSRFSEKQAVQLVKDNSNKGIGLSIIGFGEDREAAVLMRKLARMGNGSFLQVRNNEDPTELLAEEIKARSRIAP